MEYYEMTKRVEDGEYEAILREMEIWPEGDRPVYVKLFFEILDGFPGTQEPHSDDWLMYHTYWGPGDWVMRDDGQWFNLRPDRQDTVLDRLVRMVEALGIPHVEKPFPRITSLPVGHRFRVRVVRDCQVGGGRADYYSLVTEVLGLAEEAGQSTERGSSVTPA